MYAVGISVNQLVSLVDSRGIISNQLFEFVVNARLIVSLVDSILRKFIKFGVVNGRYLAYINASFAVRFARIAPLAVTQRVDEAVFDCDMPDEEEVDILAVDGIEIILNSFLAVLGLNMNLVACCAQRQALHFDANAVNRACQLRGSRLLRQRLIKFMHGRYAIFTEDVSDIQIRRAASDTGIGSAPRVSCAV